MVSPFGGRFSRPCTCHGADQSPAAMRRGELAANLRIRQAEPQNELAPGVHDPAAVLGFGFEKTECENPE